MWYRRGEKKGANAKERTRLRGIRTAPTSLRSGSVRKQDVAPLGEHSKAGLDPGLLSNAKRFGSGGFLLFIQPGCPKEEMSRGYLPLITQVYVVPTLQSRCQAWVPLTVMVCDVVLYWTVFVLYN